MNQPVAHRTTTAPAETHTTRPRSATTRHLLDCGVVAGPFFVSTVVAQVLTREGFDLSRHPISLLSLGDLGWVQVATFVATGVLVLGFAVGARRVLRPGPASRWGPVLLGALGLGLVLGGVFVTDPALGFPPGQTPPGTRSWHAYAHDVAPVLAVDGMVVGMLVFARRFARQRRRGWLVASVATPLAVLALTAWPSLDGISVRLALAMLLILGWTTALAVELRRDVSAGAR
jgi:hypothetical membrane protein